VAALLGVAGSLILLEIAARVAYPLYPIAIQESLRYVHITPFTDATILPPSIWQYSDEFGLISRAGAVDELQFPDPRISFHVTTLNWLVPGHQVGFRVDSPDWEPRWPMDVAAVGDSFTFCFTEYEDCWVQRLTTTYGLSTVNLGLAATGSVSHFHVVQDFVLPYEPRVVIWQWYGNDFNDDYGLAVQNGELPPDPAPSDEPPPSAHSPLAAWLSRNSAVYNIVDALTRSPEEMEAITTLTDPYTVTVDGQRMAYGRPYLFSAYDLSQERNQIGLEMTQQTILDARDLLATSDYTRDKTTLMLILIPTKEEVYADYTQQDLSADQLDLLRDGRQRMLTFCQENDLLCLDPTGAFQEKARSGELLYWPQNDHLNPAGNALLADLVWQFMGEHDLQPPQ